MTDIKARLRELVGRFYGGTPCAPPPDGSCWHSEERLIGVRRPTFDEYIKSLPRGKLAGRLTDAATARLTRARLIVNDWHSCQSQEELERWRRAQQELIDAAQAAAIEAQDTVMTDATARLREVLDTIACTGMPNLRILGYDTVTILTDAVAAIEALKKERKQLKKERNALRAKRVGRGT